MKIQNLSSKKIEAIANQILSMLEAGTAPWQMPWNAGDDRPFNPLSKYGREEGKPVAGHAFTGGNMWLAILLGVGKSRYWASPSQWMERGVNIAGTKSIPMIFPRTRKNKKTGEETFLGFGSYNVINATDLMSDRTRIVKGADGNEVIETISGEPEKVAAIIAPFEPKGDRTFTPIEAAEGILSGMRRHVAPITHGGNRACYSPANDSISIPRPEAFFSPEEYYSTAFHECIHSTGHVTRISRKGITGVDFFGSHQYSEEELIAEFGACFLSSMAGIAPHVVDNSAAYLAAWAEKIGDDPAIIARAIDAADAAYRWTQGEHAIQKEARERASASA
jgi:antirestriction protein ArdC